MEKKHFLLKKVKEASIAFAKHVNKILSALWKTPAGRIALLVSVILIMLAGSVSVVNHRSKTTQLGLRNIGELSTQAGYYTNVSVLENDRKLFDWSIPFTQSKYIFSYDGIIKAGYDFSQIDVQIDHFSKKVTVTLPEVQILSNEIKPDSLMIYDERQSIFSPLTIADVSNAQEVLREEAAQTAINNGLLDNAQNNAVLLLQGLLSATVDLSVYELIIQ